MKVRFIKQHKRFYCTCTQWFQQRRVKVFVVGLCKFKKSNQSKLSVDKVVCGSCWKKWNLQQTCVFLIWGIVSTCSKLKIFSQEKMQIKYKNINIFAIISHIFILTDKKSLWFTNPKDIHHCFGFVLSVSATSSLCSVVSLVGFFTQSAVSASKIYRTEWVKTHSSYRKSAFLGSVQ